MKKIHSNLDLAKLICALLVVIIHTAPLAEIAPELNFFLVDVLARIAVPLFFVMSGFLLFRGMTYENGKLAPEKGNLHKIFRYCKRIAMLYLGWSFAYIIIIKIPMWYSTGWWGTYVIKDAIVSILFAGTHYHLWYLLALFYAVPLAYFLQRFLPRNFLPLIVAFLWICECLRYSYAWLGADRVALVQWIAQHIPVSFDAVFRAVPLILSGALVARRQEKRSARCLASLASLGFLLCVVEVYWLRSIAPGSQNYSYLVFTPFLVTFLLRFILSVPSWTVNADVTTMCRNISTIVYCLHPMIIDLLVNWTEINGLALWAVVTALSAMIAFVISRYQHNKKEVVK